MAAVFAVLVSVNLIFSNVRLTGASTHWVVTEDGKVQAQMDSVFNMKRPYDLVAFMKQEDRSGMLEKLKQELLSRKDEIDKTEDRESGLEDKFYKTDIDCLAAGKQLPDLDLYISTVLPLENKGIRPDDFLPGFVQGSYLKQPDCTEYTDLPYSPYAFEHLEGMKDRRKLPGTPELGLKNAITYKDNVDEYGHRIFEAFKQNKTSWVLYNMAAFYWRIKGDPYNVIECVRRALHFSPRFQKDVALISLANVLHRAQKSNEAAIVVHAALDVSKELNVNHFTLGNIYAVLGEYNKSVICFENTLKIQPDFEAAAKRKHAVLCHAKLEGALEAQHRSLQRTLNDLKDYQRKHDFWQQQNDKMLAEQVPMEVKLAQHVAYEELKIKEISSEIGEYCRMGDKDGKQVLMCSWGKKSDPALGMDFTAKLVEESEGELEPIKSSITSVKIPAAESSKDYTKSVRGQKYTYETVKVPRAQGVTPDYLKDTWPSKDECDVHVSKVPDARNLTSTYLNPENKGFEVKPLLTEALGLNEGDEHPLPWYPPVCVTLLDIPEGNTKSHDDIHSISLEQRKTIPLKLVDTHHTELLLGHVNNGKITIEEIGQRILSGLKQNNGPKWILYNLAGLYWRIIGNNYHSIECFRRAIYTAPDDVQDAPEINLANVLYRWGKYDDAKSLIRESMKLNKYEPATNFLLGNIEWALKNYTGAIYRYELALEAEQGFTDVINTLRALKCYLRYHQAAQSVAPSEDGGEEKCVIETRSRAKQGAQNTGAQNTCHPKGPSEPTVSTIPEELFIEAEDSEDAHVKLEELPDELCEHEECSKVKVQKSSHTLFDKAQCSNNEERVKFLPELSGKKKEKKEKQAPVSLQNGQPPHIKLEFINGQLFQKLIFAQSTNELTVRPEECVIFNDGTKSEGCTRPEFQAYVGQLEEVENNPDAVTLSVNGHLTKLLPIQMKHDHLHIHLGKRPVGGVKNIKDEVKPSQEGGAKSDGRSSEIAKGPDKTEPPPYQAHIVINNPSKQQKTVRKGDILQLPDSSLPDVAQYIGRRYHISIPTAEECKRLPKLDLRRFSSTWLSLSVKHVDLKQHIDFNEHISAGDYQEPTCNYDVPVKSVADLLPGMEYRHELQYIPEGGLREVLQKIGTKVEPVEVVGTRIALALAKNETSWVITNFAALYWRVKGVAHKALDCLRVSMYSAPTLSKDVSLLSMANILHRAGYLNDAIVAASHAMDLSPNLVVGHFNMANLYAAKEKWRIAAMFYETTLGLQSSFEPARQRLKLIHCMKVLRQHKQ